MAQEILLKLDDQPSSKQAMLVSNLKDTLEGLAGIDTAIKKERENSQDTGTILSIVLSAPAVLLAVKAIAAWSVRNNQSSMTFETSDGKKFVAKNLASEDVPKTADAIKELLK